MAAVGAGLFRVDAALAGIGSRRADMPAASGDPMPAGTSGPVDRTRSPWTLSRPVPGVDGAGFAAAFALTPLFWRPALA